MTPRLRRLFSIRRRRNTGDRVLPATPGIAAPNMPAVLVSGHHDERLTPRARLAWAAFFGLLVAGGIVAIALTR